MKPTPLPKRTGAMAAFIALLLPLLLGLAALAVNLVYLELCATQTQIAADAAARSAGRAYATTKQPAEALAAAREAARHNPIGDEVLSLERNDLEFGRADRDGLDHEYNFTPVSDASTGNAVRLTTRSFSRNRSRGARPLLPLPGFEARISPLKTATVTQGVVDISLVLDRSGSMAYASDETADYPPNPAAAPSGWKFGDPVPPRARWLDLIASTRGFIEELKQSPNDERLALTLYADGAGTPVPLTDQFDDAVSELTQVSRNFELGGTNTSLGMREGVASLADPDRSRAHAQRVMVLMTDGVHNMGPSPAETAGQVRDAGVMLFIVTFSDEADQQTMQTIVDKYGAVHFHATDGVKLRKAFRDIVRQIPNLLVK